MCQQHGWKYAATNRYRFFCSLCRDLKKLPCDEQRDVNDWLAEHEQLLTGKSTSVFSFGISNLLVRTGDEDGQSRLEPSEAIKGDVEADFFDRLRAKLGPEPDEQEFRVCIAGIYKGSIRSAALKYGLAPSMVHRVRLDIEMKGIKTATERLLNYAGRKLRQTETTEPQVPVEAGLAAD